LEDRLLEKIKNGPSGLCPKMLNHVAWVTHDVAKTADFYARIMGMEIASTVFGLSVPSTKDDFPYFHIFFRMGDGSTFAFFEVPGLPGPAQASHPAYDVFNHIALQAKDKDEVLHWRDWLISNDISVIGPVDHSGLIYSIYFHDPNGIRLEITVPLDPDWNYHGGQAMQDLADWVRVKEEAIASGGDVGNSLKAFISRRKGHK
jgi:catechol 2,3-dioxygenase-like lactoylglutathione lyase family enzyme